MKIDITVCPSVLKYCFDGFNPFQKSGIQAKMLDELYRRKLAISSELEEAYLHYFETNRPELVDTYQSFFAGIMQEPDGIKMIKVNRSCSIENQLIKALVNVCVMTEDKILISEEVQNVNYDVVRLCFLSVNDIFDETKPHVLNKYRLPIQRKRVNCGEDSSELGFWLSRFLRTENELSIIDGYVFDEDNIRNFLMYFLRYIPRGAKIKIYTMLNGMSPRHIDRILTSAPFKSWNFEVYIFANKKEQHARNISTNRYYIDIDKGMCVFGKRGITEQADINAGYIDEVKNYAFPTSRKVI